MARWLNQRIRRRIFLGFGFAALVTLAVALLSISYQRGVGQELATVADQDRLLQTSALELRIALAEESDGVRGFLLSGNEVLLEPFTRGRSMFTAKTAVLRDLVQSQDDQRLLAEAESLHASFLDIANEQVTLHEQGFPRAAVFLWQTAGTEVRTSLDSTLDDLIARQDETIAAHTRNVKSEQNEALVISLGLVGLAWVAVITGGIWISRGITNPLADLSNTASQIAAGDLTLVANAEREDEIGSLARAFNSMTVQIRSLVEGLEQRVADRTRELKELEELGRAILNGPPDASTLSDVLGEHVPLMFPNGQIEIRVFPDQTLLCHPGNGQLATAAAWEWLATQSEARHFLPGELLSWDTQATGDALAVTPILDMATKEPIGGIYLSLHRDPDVAPSLLPAVNSLAAQIASALHGAEVYSQDLAHKTVARELALAGQIQANFLPDKLPDVPGWQLAAMLEPARETSGDFYDVIPLPNGRLGILVADVADKGMGAALYMALSRTLIRTFAVEYDSQPELALSAANHRILADAGSGLFVTVFYGILDPSSGELAYSNAGHNPPYLLRTRDGNTILELERTGVPLGIFDGATWERKSACLAPADVLLMYTDGITEAQNAHGEFFDEDRLLEIVRAGERRSAQNIRDDVIAQVDAFVGDTPQFDDMTLMVVVHGPGGQDVGYIGDGADAKV